MRSLAALNKANALFGISIARFFQQAQSACGCEHGSQAMKALLNVFIEKEYKKELWMFCSSTTMRSSWRPRLRHWNLSARQSTVRQAHWKPSARSGSGMKRGGRVHVSGVGSGGAARPERLCRSWRVRSDRGQLCALRSGARRSYHLPGGARHYRSACGSDPDRRIPGRKRRYHRG